MSNPKRFKFSVNDFWLKSEAEMKQNMVGVSQQDILTALNNTDELASKCSFELEIPKQEESLPRHSLDEQAALRELVTKGWKEKKHGHTKVEKARVLYELEVIEQKRI